MKIKALGLLLGLALGLSVSTMPSGASAYVSSVCFNHTHRGFTCLYYENNIYIGSWSDIDYWI